MTIAVDLGRKATKQTNIRAPAILNLLNLLQKRDQMSTHAKSSV